MTPRLVQRVPSLGGEQRLRAECDCERETSGRTEIATARTISWGAGQMAGPGREESVGRVTVVGRNHRPHLDLNPVFRAGILAVTSNPLVSRGVQRYGMRLGASRFVAGETFAEAIPVLRSLNQCGLRTNTTLLGEGVTDPATTLAVVAEYKSDLDTIAAEGLQTNIALKLTHLGLDLDPEVAYRNVAEVGAHAETPG